MFVVWKRPDGFHGASPADFSVVEIQEGAKLWLHKSDHNWYPFRVSGGWKDEEETKKLNRLINLIDKDDHAWLKALSKSFDDVKQESPEEFITQICEWLENLEKAVKGDHWEVEIMVATIKELRSRINQVKGEFYSSQSN